jgi:hypothetical protein
LSTLLVMQQLLLKETCSSPADYYTVVDKDFEDILSRFQQSFTERKKIIEQTRTRYLERRCEQALLKKNYYSTVKIVRSDDKRVTAGEDLQEVLMERKKKREQTTQENSNTCNEQALFEENKSSLLETAGSYGKEVAAAEELQDVLMRIQENLTCRKKISALVRQRHEKRCNNLKSTMSLEL